MRMAVEFDTQGIKFGDLCGGDSPQICNMFYLSTLVSTNQLDRDCEKSGRFSVRYKIFTR